MASFENEKQDSGVAEPISLCYSYPRYVPAPNQGDLTAVRTSSSNDATVTPNATWQSDFYKYANRIYLLDRTNGSRTVDYDGVFTIPPAGENEPGYTGVLNVGDTISFRARTWNNTNASVTIGGEVLTTGTTAWQNGMTYTVGTSVQELPFNVSYDTTGSQNDYVQIQVYVNGTRRLIRDEWFSPVGGASQDTVFANVIIAPDGTETVTVDGVAAPEGSALHDEFTAAQNNGLAIQLPCEIAGSASGTINKSVNPQVATSGETVTFTIDFEVTQNDGSYNTTITDVLPSNVTFVSASSTTGTVNDSDPNGVGISVDLGVATAPTTGTLTIVGTKNDNQILDNTSELRFDNVVLSNSQVIAISVDPVIPTQNVLSKGIQTAGDGTIGSTIEWRVDMTADGSSEILTDLLSGATPISATVFNSSNVDITSNFVFNITGNEITVSPDVGNTWSAGDYVIINSTRTTVGDVTNTATFDFGDCTNSVTSELETITGGTTPPTTPPGTLVVPDCATATLIKSIPNTAGWTNTAINRTSNHSFANDIVTNNPNQNIRQMVGTNTYEDLQGVVTSEPTNDFSIPSLPALKSTLQAVQTVGTGETFYNGTAYENGTTVRLYDINNTVDNYVEWLPAPDGGYWVYVAGTAGATVNSDRSVDNSMDYGPTRLLKFRADFTFDEVATAGTGSATAFTARPAGGVEVLGDYIYMQNADNTNVVDVFNVADGTSAGTVTLPAPLTTGDRQWARRQVGEDGNLYVTMENNYVYRIDGGQTSGSVTPVFDLAATSGNTEGSHAVLVDSSGNLYTAFPSTDHIDGIWDGSAFVAIPTGDGTGPQKFTQTGNVIAHDPSYRTNIDATTTGNFDSGTFRQWFANGGIHIQPSIAHNVTDSEGVVRTAGNSDILNYNLDGTAGEHTWGFVNSIYNDIPTNGVLGLADTFFVPMGGTFRTDESNPNKETFQDIIYNDIKRWAWWFYDSNGEAVPVAKADFVLADGTECP